jgi:hypothetical protein
MAKDKEMGGKKGNARGSLPNRIAGIKLPKSLRNSGSQAIHWAASPTGRETLGGLLVAAAAALAGSRRAREAVGDSAREAASGASRVGHALADAATEVARRVTGDSETRAPGSTDSGGRSKSKRPTAKRGKHRPGAPTFTH